jgi:hypothetical protein
MTVTAAGRDIYVDDRMNKWYEELGQGPVSEIFVLDELATLFHKDPIELCHTLSDKELTDFVHNSILDFLNISFPGPEIRVKDRQIRIPECLAEEYEKMGVGSIDELYVLSNLGVMYGQDLDNKWKDIKDCEIEQIVARAILEEILF